MKYLISFFLFLSSPLAAQYSLHEFSLHVAAGLSHLNFGPASAPGAGGSAGLGYRYYLSRRWSLGTGAELQFYSSKAKLDAVSGNSEAIDIEGTPFRFRYYAEEYRETQKAVYGAIPLNLQFETGRQGTSWYLNIGGKMAFNLGGTYQAHLSELSTKGFYPQWSAELSDPAFMGFGQWTDARSEKKTRRTRTAFLLSGETGIKLPDFFLTYLGVYADYGLNDILKHPSPSPLLTYITDDPTRFSYSPITDSFNKEGIPFAKKMNPFSVGIQLKIVVN